MNERPIIIHDLNDAMVAISIASQLESQVTLKNAPGTANFFGPQVFKEIVEQAKAKYKRASVRAIFDCGEDVGMALRALRHGVKLIRIKAPRETLKKISSIATKLQAQIDLPQSTLSEGTLSSLNLLDLDDAEGAIKNWLND